MSFNLEKCHVIPVTRNKTVIKTQYMLHGEILETVSQAKFLGITITSDLWWNARINNISLKANRLLGFFHRNFSLVISNKNSGLLHLCQTHLRKQLYCPYTFTQINQLEMIQCCAAQYVLHCHHNTSSVTDMLQTLG